MSKVYDRIEQCLKQVREKTDFQPKVALILGSGLGDFATEIKVEAEIPYGDIEGFPVSTVAGHDGRFIFGKVGEVPVVCMKGRVHYYEGYTMEDVVLPTRLMHMMGAQILFLTNAAGGVGEDMEAGDLMMLTDQISCFVPNPLIGPNPEELGTRFPDMSQIYEKDLQELIRKTAQTEDISLKEGVYCQLTGPSYETPAEIRMVKTLGADAVGMSTSVEAIAGRHCGMRVCGISLISNKAAGLSATPLSHKEVQEAADKASAKFKRLVKKVISQM